MVLSIEEKKRILQKNPQKKQNSYICYLLALTIEAEPKHIQNIRLIRAVKVPLLISFQYSRIYYIKCVVKKAVLGQENTKIHMVPLRP